MLQTDQLVIVGGPSAAGKSSLLENIKQGNSRELCDKITLNDPDLCLYTSASNLNKVRQNFVDKLILHYDFIDQYDPKNCFPYLADLIDRSNSVSVLTLCASSRTLLERISSRLKKIETTRPFEVERIMRLREKKETYSDKEKLYKEYVRWLEFVESLGVDRHIIVNSENTHHYFWARDPNEAKRILAVTLAGHKLTN